MKTKKICVLVLISFYSLMTFSQEGVAMNPQIVEKKLTHNIGFSFGSSGEGLSYRYWIQSFGIQNTLGGYSETYSGSNVNYGLSFLYKIYESRILNFFVYEGNMIYQSKNVTNFYNYPTSNYTYEIIRRLNNSLGIGIELVAWKRVSFNLQGGYGLYSTAKTTDVNFSGELGIFFKF